MHYFYDVVGPPSLCAVWQILYLLKGGGLETEFGRKIFYSLLQDMEVLSIRACLCYILKLILIHGSEPGRNGTA
jgi:hypothetical protein